MKRIDEVCVALEMSDMENIYAGAIPWGTVAKVAVRVVAGAAGVATGVGAVLTATAIAYEVCDALDII